MIKNQEDFIILLKVYCKEKNIKFGDLEKQIGARAGYFSRTLNKQTSGFQTDKIDKIVSVLKFDGWLDLIKTLEQHYIEYTEKEKRQKVINDFGEVTAENVEYFVETLKDNGIIRSDEE